MQNEQSPPKPSIRVLVADSSSIHTFLLANALKRDPQLEVIPFNSDSRELPAYVVAQSIDVLVISCDLQDEPSRGLDALRELRTKHPITRTVVLVNLPKREVVLNAFRAGAKGVFCKSEPIELLCKCVRCVHQGQIWANSSELSLAVEALAGAPAVHAVNADGMSLLSKRELQVVRCLAEGLTNREIAERLKLSQHTVKNYLFRVFDKLGVSSRVELLFMTLSQSAPNRSWPDWPSSSERTGSPDDFVLCQRAAEAGLPAAQLALAQMYLTRKTGPQDLVHAYMWYLIAMERASQAKGVIAKVMTPAQIDEARRGASAWLSRPERTPLAALQSRPSPQLSSAAEGRHFKSLD
jgi:two-component system, NarL family, nitrate/nitrite response regulator NarL